VIVLGGLATTVAPVVTLSPVEGDHVYEVDPLAVRVTEPPGHIVAAAGATVIFCGVVTLTARQLAALPVPHEFIAVTQICPDVFPIVTVMVVVPCPDVIVAPGGTDQLYETAPETGEIEYVADCPAQTVVGPEISPGIAVLTDTIWTKRQLGGLEPQLLPAITQILPEVPPAVIVMVVVPCPEFMTVPAGTVHV
jgi:hypothetical protein